MSEIILGDCLDIMPEIPDNSIDMILCDLPYGTTTCKWDTIIPFDALWNSYKRIIRDNKAIVLMASQPFTSALVISNIKMFKYEWVWDKHIPRGFQNARYRPMMKHENILIFGNGRINYYPIMIKRDKPVTVRNYCKKESSHKLLGKYNDGRKFTYTHKNPDSIIIGCWEANKGKLHPTQKPVSLFEYLIKTYTNEGDLVLDNCAGSGTTGVACKNLNRNFILIEKEQKYFDIILGRLNA